MSVDSGVVTVPMDVTYQPAWLTWVASTTTCLRALGVECDLADVAGMSGYAFHLGISSGLCPSGPTMVDLTSLSGGIPFLGRTTLTYHSLECHTGDLINDRTRAHCRAAFEIAQREVEAGRPCVLWGAYVPEFAVVTGIEGDSYIVKSFREGIGQPQPPVPYDGVDAPGGPYILAFPSATGHQPGDGDQRALANAARLLNTPTCGDVCYGLSGYDKWIGELRIGTADSFGMSYNAACYAESRGFAYTFLSSVAERHPSLYDELDRAAFLYSDAMIALGQIQQLFPFPAAGGPVTDDAKIAECVDALESARDAESQAAALITDIAARVWSAED